MKLLIAGAGFIVSDFLPITKDLKNTKLVGIAGTTSDLDHMKEYQAKYSMIKRLKKQMQIQFMSQYLTLFIILLQKKLY